jgi:zinc protease
MHCCGARRLWVFAAIFASGSAYAGPASGVSVGQSTDKLGTIDLPSGMRIVIEEDHSKPVVAVVAVINAGAAEDPVGKEGLAHLVEHLTFRAKPDGKVRRSNQLDFAGAASWNASTTHDLTTYMVVGPKEALKNLLVIEGGRLMGPLAGVDERAFDVEREVVKNEMSDREEQGQPSAVQALLYEVLYPEGHRYHRPVVGTPATVSALSLADAQAFVQKHYVPSNVTLYVAGDVDLATIHQLFGATLPEHFAVAPPSGPVKPPVRLPKDAPVVPAVPAARPVKTVKAPVARPMLYIAWSLPHGSGLDGTLERAIRSGIEAYSVWGSRNSDIESIQATLVAGRDSSTLLCAVTLKEGRRPEKSLEKVLDEFHRFSEPGASTSGSNVGQIDSNRSDSTLAGGSGGRFLAPQSGRMSGNEGGDNIGFSTQVQNATGSVTPVSVQVARLKMTAVVGEVVETESVLARAEDRATLAHWTGDSSAWDKDLSALTDLGASKWEAFTLEWLSRNRARAVFVEPSGVTSVTIEDGPPVVFAADDVRAKIASGALKTYAHGPVGDIQSLTLKNGLQVLLVRRLGAPSVAAAVGVRGGGATAEPLGVAQLVGRLATPTEVGNGPPSQFGGSLAYTITPDATYVDGRAASGNLENLLAVLSDTVQSLHIDDGVRWAWNELVDGKRRSDASPNAEAERKFLAEVYPGTAMGRTALADNFKQLGPSDLQKWVDRTFRANNAVLAVVGDIDVKEAEKLVRDSFEGWKGDRSPKAPKAGARRGSLSDQAGPVPISWTSGRSVVSAAVAGAIDAGQTEKLRSSAEEAAKAEAPLPMTSQRTGAEASLGTLSERTGPVRVVVIERPGAPETEIRVGCSIEPRGQESDLAAMRLLGTRLRTKLGTLARSTLGGSDGFSGGATVQRQAARLDVAGTVDGRALIAVLGAARKEVAALADLKATEDELALLKWRQGIAWAGGYTTNAELAQGLVWTRLADLPVDLMQNYPDLLAAVTLEDLTRVAAECRKTAVLLVSGDPAIVDKALLATEGSAMLLRQGH